MPGIKIPRLIEIPNPGDKNPETQKNPEFPRLKSRGKNPEPQKNPESQGFAGDLGFGIRKKSHSEANSGLKPIIFLGAHHPEKVSAHKTRAPSFHFGRRHSDYTRILMV